MERLTVSTRDRGLARHIALLSQSSVDCYVTTGDGLRDDLSELPVRPMEAQGR
jgi:hypothetical protein